MSDRLRVRGPRVTGTAVLVLAAWLGTAVPSRDARAQADDKAYEGWPAWAKRVWLGPDGKSGLLAERAKAVKGAAAGATGAAAPGPAGNAQPAPPSPPRLYELDNEVDMFAGALITLGEGRAAAQVYREWYDSQERTPAAILLYARALRLQAHQLLDRPPKDTDPLKNFENAQNLLSQALNKLDAVHKQFGAFDDRGGGTPPAFVTWVQKGLPKPVSLDDTDPTHTERFPPFLAFDYIKRYLEWESLVARELGDLVYERTGSGLTRAPWAGGGESGQSPVAAAYYTQAREALYLARLFDPQSNRLKEHADELEKRIGWLRAGLPYGGEDFYQFAWYSPVNNVPYWTGQLTEAINAIDRLSGTQAQRKLAVTTWIAQTEENDRTRGLLQGQFKFQLNDELRSKRAELTLKVAGLESERAFAALSAAHQELDIFFKMSLYERNGIVYDQNLEREMGRMRKEAEGVAGEVRELGGLRVFVPLLKRTDPDNAGAKRLAEKQRLVAATFGPQWASIEGSIDGPGLIDAKVAERDHATVALALAQADLANHEQRSELERLEKESIPGFEKALEGIDSELKELAKQGDQAMTAPQKQQKYDELRNRFLPGLRKDIARANDQINEARKRLSEFADYARRTRATLQLIQDTRKAAADLYAHFKRVMDGASFTPITITSPTGGGISVDIAGGLEKLWRSTIAAIDKEIQDLTASQDLSQLLEKLETKARTLNDNLRTAQDAANAKQEEWFRAVDDLRVRGRVAMPADGPLAEINAKIKAITDAKPFDQLRSEVRKLEEDARRAFAGTLLEGLADRAARDAARAATGKINGLQSDTKKVFDEAIKSIGEKVEAATKGIDDWQKQTAPNDPEYGKVWIQFARMRVEIEARRAVTEANLAACRGRAEALRGSLGEHARQQLQRQVQLAQARQRAADAELGALKTRQETRWLELVALAELYAMAAGHKTVLEDLDLAFRGKLEELGKRWAERRIEFEKAQADLKVAEKEALSEVDRLTDDLRRLNRPQGRILTAEMLDRLAPALEALERVDVDNDELARQTARANRALVNYGRWLYLLSGDRQCLEYASRRDGLAEFQAAKAKLDSIWEDVKGQFGNAKPNMFMVTLPGKRFSPGAARPDLAGMRLRLKPHRPGAPLVDADKKYLFEVPQFHFGDEDPQRAALTALPNYTHLSDEAAATASVELGFLKDTQSIFVGCIPVASWRRGVGDIAYTLRCLPVGRPVAPGQFTVSSLPIWYPGAFGTPTQFMTHAAAARRLFAIFNNPIDALEAPAETQLLNVEAFGRGIFSDFWVEIEPTRAGDEGPIPLDDLESVSLYFFYQMRPGARAIAPRVGGLRIADLGLKSAWPDDIASAWDDIASAWDDPARAAELVDRWKSGGPRGGSGEDVRRAINDQLATVLRTRAAKESPGAIFQPVPLDRTLRVASGVAQLLHEEIEKQALEPLNSAHNALKATRDARDRIRTINNIVARENTRFSNLSAHVGVLADIDGVLRQVQPGTKAGLDTLRELPASVMDDALRGPVLARVLQGLNASAATRAAARASAVQFLLDQLRSEYVNANDYLPEGQANPVPAATAPVPH